MIKYIKYIFFLILLLLNNCSFDKKSGIWSGYEEEIKRVAELEAESKIISSKIITSEETNVAIPKKMPEIYIKLNPEIKTMAIQVEIIKIDWPKSG